MGGRSTSNTQQSQKSSTEPWAPVIPGLEGVVNALPPLGNTQPTSAESNAINSIQSSAGSLGDYTPQATGLLNNLFSGGIDRTGIVNDAYSQYKQQLNPYANGNPDPTQTPGIQNVLDTIRSDVGNSINGMFAGAGRDLSGAHAQALARGISQGEAVPLLNQYNANADRNIGAANGLLGAGGATAGLLSGLDQTALNNQAQGLNIAPSINNANVGANATLNAGQLERGLPLSNLGQVLNLLLPIAGLGQQSQGTGTSNTTNQMSGAQQFATIASGVGGLTRALFPFGV